MASGVGSQKGENGKTKILSQNNNDHDDDEKEFPEKVGRDVGEDEEVASTESSGSEILNDLDDQEGDLTAVALLKQIFPPEEANTEELRRQHHEFCNRLAEEQEQLRRAKSAEESVRMRELRTASLIARNSSSSSRRRPDQQPQWRKGNSPILPDDFLRLPSNVAVRRFVHNQWQYDLISELERRTILQHERVYAPHREHWDYVTKVVPRDQQTGDLGLSLVEQQGVVHVYSVVGDDGVSAKGPAFRRGVQHGDVLIGINGEAFVEMVPPNTDSLVRHAVSVIQSSQDPVVLHLQRPQSRPLLLQTTPPPSAVMCGPISAMTPSLLDTSDLFSEPDTEEATSTRLDVSFASDLSDSQVTPVQKNSYKQHIPHFIRLLAERRALRSQRDEIEATRMLQNFNFRARQWEELSSFQIPSAGVFIPLAGVRKALSVRIVNTFQDDRNDTAYTIWVYDVESGREWYAPVRFLRDFEDLRTATMSLYAPIAQIPFPRPSRSSLSLFRSPSRDETSLQRENKCRQLEVFLRTLCAMVYTEKLHPAIVEIAIHVQSFLGCDDQSLEDEDSGPPVVIECIDDPSASLKENEALQHCMRLRLKRSLQLYIYRLFLLDAMAELVGNFVDAVRTNGPRLQEIESLEAEGRGVLKAHAMRDLGRIQAFIDNLLELILEGCGPELMAMARQPRFGALHGRIFQETNGRSGVCGYWDGLVREAVREQVEIEVYVPLRSVVSRWLVHGWRHEDMEIQFKIKELRQRPQEFFRIVKGSQRPDWSSVSRILGEGVGLSTLPCVKLHAIVDAAREIFRIFAENALTGSDSGPTAVACNSPKERHLGADDFLPIFIYCVVQAEMERPCALCVLLSTLCDRINKIGEIGYYLQTFEAAIAHCQEVDLTEDREEMQSFLSVPLDEHYDNS